MNIYDFKFKTIDGEDAALDKFKGKVLLIVNTASKCGFTPQYKDLQKLYEKYNAKGFEILGFPSNQFADQEPSNNDEVKNFCEINFGVTFPLSEKVDVRGNDAHPIFKYLTQQVAFGGFDINNPSGKMLHAFLQEKFPDFLLGDSVKWNFTKFLIDKSGNVVERFESPIEPMDIEENIKKLL
ncbi:glutathione peroxidase [Clostridium tagluense]|uniref:glutathione peroxidase n=1 Tax=Clostridium tagluense TaxID=360422 RepID=UPI001CF54F1C|nr:glutathione peroxidase [Clostridium tagluense]MCB2309910.1 glutathione peroxidase [Clostridium tagluense]MCB2314560.1 glutathione peroxidase [Clostridium tagluense]MCB2319408.1 glutathione peroxidase [Clostridium tagluense]MCB2324504.1 glutathione peroxidase [Clostridium tagluense]MCB2329355.1 glutathione peroxidase [Clostridium tagluense]